MGIDKSRRRNFQKLWQSSTTSNEVSYEKYCEKELSSFCRKVDLCENIQSYVLTMSQEVKRLISLSIPKEMIRKNKIAFQKIQRLGEDIMEVSPAESDQFYIGSFIDIQLPTKWYDSVFYDLISSLFEKVSEKKIVLSGRIKRKLMAFIKYHRHSYDTLGYTYKVAT